MMTMLKRTVALYLALTALAVAVLLAVTPLFHDGSSDYPAWEVMNWFMAAGVVILLAAHIGRYVRANEDGDFPASLLFYGVIVLAMLFFWGWFWTLNPDSETGDAVTSHLIYFPVVDALYTVLGLATARRVWDSTLAD